MAGLKIYDFRPFLHQATRPLFSFLYAYTP